MDNHNVSHENQDAASFQPTKWDMCALCQKNTKEKLQCPANARQTNQGSTYVTLAKNLTKFGECGALSPDILTRLDDGDGKAPAKDLRHASTFKVDERIRNCALILQESHLLAKLSRGDVIAQELKYHPACLTSLYRKAQPKVDCTDQRSDQIRKALVFAELTEYIEEVKHSSTGHNLKVLKLADLSKTYLSRLQEVGLETGCLHSSRLKTRLLAHFPDLQAYNSGRDILLTFTDSLNTTLQEAYAETIDDEAVHLAKAARIVRRDLFSLQARFNASCTEDVQNTSIPESLLALMQMILHGPSITSNKGKNQAALSLAQLASFNAVKTEGKRSRANTSTTNKHSKNREPPVPVYVGLTIHAQTRKKELVERMHSLGLSISYKRVLEMSSELAAKACRQFQHDKVVCPMKLRHGLFTTAAVDNIDHNPSSTTSKDSFHGTA
ncbi:hypothetical protein Bpfe_014897 [Biomphalaria pfeifferi]|uniref:Uncharacterized protein n=1 Tax=Biomphalaria pfeifferi TaxID=112525 RepID=A0AAD8F8J2_BIOPF|nr:hypothetical protein Bpfe_014897 [Biomphalaria pfeifferi]